MTGFEHTRNAVKSLTKDLLHVSFFDSKNVFYGKSICAARDYLSMEENR